MKYEEAIKILGNISVDYSGMNQEEIDQMDEALTLAFNAMSILNKSKGIDWRSIEDAHVLKARHSDYVIYQVDFLLNNLGKEIYILESGRRGTPCEIARSEDGDQ